MSKTKQQILKPKNELFPNLIHWGFVLLFFLTPLLISFRSSELFEFPKMLFVYFATAMLAAFWLADMCLQGKIIFKKSWLDLVFVLVIVTQLFSSLASLDRYTSFFGYYSRFHGGFWSTLCYVLLALIFKTYARKTWVQDVLMASLASASLVSLYGIAEHFGIDAAFWVQDVQNRVFSTLGQPNWLAAWLGALLPFAYLWFLKPPRSFWPTVISPNVGTITGSYGITYLLTKSTLPISGTPFVIFIICYGLLNGLVMYKARWLHEKLNFLQRGNFLLLIILMQTTLLFTKSRSGILALFISTLVFLFYEFFNLKKIKSLLPLVLGFILLVLLIGTEWTPSIAKLLSKSNQVVKNPLTAKSTNPGISDSTDIRQVVWQGAYTVWQQYPLFGSGTETFAYSYYNFRPKEHNLNSEWDFLYNKAHNEYLNFLANNGLLGTAAILALFLAVVWLALKPQLRSWAKTFVILSALTLILYLLSPWAVKAAVHKLLIYPPLLIPLTVALVMAGFLLWGVRRFSPPDTSQKTIYSGAIFASMISIVVTNFYGLSVVTVGMLFFMLPAWILLLTTTEEEAKTTFNLSQNTELKYWLTWVGVPSSFILALFIAIFVRNYYQADLAHNYSESYLKTGDVLQADKEIDKALNLHSGNANYYIQKGLVAAQTAFLVHYKDASDSSGLVQHYNTQAVKFTQEGLLKNPVHVNLYKSAARTYITLGLIDKQYSQFAIQTLQMAAKLSPTDPQIPVNIALLYQQAGQLDQAISNFNQAIELKPDYLQARFLLAQLYEAEKRYPEAIAVYRYVLDNLNPQDKTSIVKIEQLQKELP